MRVLVTGGGGFIGSHVAERFIDSNKITIYDNAHRDSLKYTNIRDHKNMTFVKGDILDFNHHGDGFHLRGMPMDQLCGHIISAPSRAY